MQKSAEVEMMAACGLDCGRCVIRRLPFDDEAATRCVSWFRQMGWLSEEEGAPEAVERGMYCRGCLGDRTVHWSVDGDDICWILQCCVDERGHEHCAECNDFPCDRLVEWGTTDDAYSEALERLRRVAAQRGSQ